MGGNISFENIDEANLQGVSRVCVYNGAGFNIKSQVLQGDRRCGTSDNFSSGGLRFSTSLFGTPAGQTLCLELGEKTRCRSQADASGRSVFSGAGSGPGNRFQDGAIVSFEIVQAIADGTSDRLEGIRYKRDGKTLNLWTYGTSTDSYVAFDSLN